MDRRHLLRLAFGAGAAAGLATATGCNRDHDSGRAAGLITTQLGDTVQGSSPMVAAERYFAEQVAELTQGQYAVNVLPGGALGDDNRVNEAVRTGQVAFAKSLATNLTAYDKRMGVLALPYVFNDEKQCMTMLAGELGRRCTSILDDYGLVVLAWFYAGDRNIYNAKRPIYTPDDLKGLRIRVPQNIVSIDMVNAMGGNAVPMATNDILSALKQRVVDGAENSDVFYLSEQHVLYAPYFSRTRHQQSVDVLLASKNWLSTQPIKVQDAVREAGRLTQAKQIEYWNAEADTIMVRARIQGAKVNAVDLGAFRRALAPVLTEHRGTFGDLATLLPDG